MKKYIRKSPKTEELRKKILIDKEDYYVIDNKVLSITKNNYITVKNHGDKAAKYLSRIIMNCPKGMIVDHINHNTLDNRKTNLKKVYLGCFNNEIDAARAYNDAATKYFGQYAYLNKIGE